ncbi:MAG: GNAT family N-acetyltransferase [Actinobacteria bacterium]|uniref:Unannotated protein n=1 Tax=freshwater metagenome TaxID=449393 RepID=A0A6J6SKZ0_9ZZZZ|nr:GNAT family N-acetyltransferase [Actinomycetota bacterium]
MRRDPVLRRAEPQDLARIGEITVAAYASFTLGPDDPYVGRLRDAALRDREAELWVAADGEELLGSVTVCPTGSPWREIANDDEGEFRMLAVAPAAQGRGVGQALVAHAVGIARQEGRRGVAISSLVEMTDAHRLYDRCGFVRAPERDWSPVPGVELIAFAFAWG